MSGPSEGRCTDRAEAAGDALAGTAPPADAWLLLEHPGPWGRVAFAQSGLPADAVTAFDRWARRESGRVLLIRRPGRRGADQGAPGGPRRWFRVDSRPGHESVRTGVLDPADVAAAVTDTGTDHPDPLHLVCTHGRHDTCCAVRGRPVAAALAAAAPTRTWECSHVGGCRFAPALVLLPEGLVYGHLPVDEALAVVRARPPHRFLRGRSCDPPVVQAAQQHARRHTGAPGAPRPEHVEVLSPGRWRVRFADPACTVVLQEHRTPADRPLTCAATTPGVLRTFELISLG